MTKRPQPLYQMVDLAEASARPPRVALSPFPSLFMLTADALSPDACFGAPREWRARIRSALTEAEVTALAPVVESGGLWPDCIVPPPGRGEATVDEFLERIADTSDDALVGELAELGLAERDEWSRAVSKPRRWLNEYAIALRQAWLAVDQLWTDAAALLDREIERIGMATVRGAVPELLGRLHPRAWVQDGVWHFPPGQPQNLRVPEVGLVIAPMLAGPQASIRYGENGVFTHLAYPMPGVTRLSEPARSIPELDVLLGGPRAAILRMLDRPVTNSDIAAAMFAVPSAACHHLKALEASGLVQRERDGRRVFVRRTARGTTLLELYEH